MEDRTWKWSSDLVFAGGGARHPKPSQLGELRITDEGLSVEPDDGYYAGTLPPEQAIELARAILQRFGSARYLARTR
jgi:hypothetical protein